MSGEKHPELACPDCDRGLSLEDGRNICSQLNAYERTLGITEAAGLVAQADAMETNTVYEREQRALALAFARKAYRAALGRAV